MINIHLVAAARPNFMKIAPLFHQCKKCPDFHTKIIHTGQHYDYNMSEAFFKDLELPEPDVNLEIGSGTHAQQTGGVLIAYEKYLRENIPDLVVVAGDVNSTIACTLAAKKLQLQVAHLESGLRSFDRTMPEEINRILTDSISDILWTPSPDADVNLSKEGIESHRIKRVGNIMIDSFLMLQKKIATYKTWKEFGLAPQNYGIITIHRPSNTDEPLKLKNLVNSIINLSSKIPLVLPVHPRLKEKLLTFDLMSLLDGAKGIVTCEPISYIKFMSLLEESLLVITDSGGLQEETTFMNIPCLTLRKNTERPITCSQGTNELVSLENITSQFEKIIAAKWKQTIIPELWDGRTAKRVVEDIMFRFKIN